MPRARVRRRVGIPSGLESGIRTAAGFSSKDRKLGALDVVALTYAHYVLTLARREYSDHLCTLPKRTTAGIRGTTMKDGYDFTKGKRGRVLPPEPEPEGKTRITIPLDQDIVDRFFRMAEESGG